MEKCVVKKFIPILRKQNGEAGTEMFTVIGSSTFKFLVVWIITLSPFLLIPFHSSERTIKVVFLTTTAKEVLVLLFAAQVRTVFWREHFLSQ